MKKVKSINEYFKSIPKEERGALEKLRKMIKSLAPDATECVSYGMPAFKYKEKLLAYFAAFKDHYSYFPASSNIIRKHKKDLKPHITTKGTIHFTAAKPLPKTLIKKLIKTRIKEIKTRTQRQYG